MKILPRYTQFKKWSLPSKYSALGLIIGILSLAYTIYENNYTDLSSSPTHNRQKSENQPSDQKLVHRKINRTDEYRLVKLLSSEQICNISNICLEYPRLNRFVYTKSTLKIRASPSHKSKCRHFSKTMRYKLLKVEDETLSEGQKWLLISSNNETLGWIEKSTVLNWPTRIAAVPLISPTQKPSRSLLFKTVDDAIIQFQTEVNEGLPDNTLQTGNPIAILDPLNSASEDDFFPIIDFHREWTDVGEVNFICIFVEKFQRDQENDCLWMADRDPGTENPKIDARMLLARREVNDLAQVLHRVSEAVKNLDITDDEYFGILQSAAYQALLPERLSGVNLPEDHDMSVSIFPYYGRLLSIDEHTWRNLTASGKQEIINSIDDTVEYLRLISASADHFFHLDDEAELHTLVSLKNIL